jgi:hypothetical protein
MFPSDAGMLRTPNSLDCPLAKCLEAAEVNHHFTVHGLRYTFTDLIRLSNADAVVRRALTGHVTQEMQQHYSHVGTEEKRAAIAGALQLLASVKAGKNGGCYVARPEAVQRNASSSGFGRTVTRTKKTRFAEEQVEQVDGSTQWHN